MQRLLQLGPASERAHVEALRREALRFWGGQGRGHLETLK